MNDKIGRYVLRRSLGKGGMGEVFLAYDELCDREIALKRIRADLKNNSSIKTRFLREAQIAAKLSHPSIIPIHSIEYDEEKVPYYTMPYIEGESLRQILHQSRLEEKKGAIHHPIGSSIPILLRIFLNACQAIAFSHSKGILHRDLKPENILVGKFGETMIVDWGLAEYVENASAEEFDEATQEVDAGLTRPGKVVGTLAYIAPERARHEPASNQSDLYSLGVILYQILTLRTPFRRKDIKTFRKQMQHEKFMTPLEIAPYRDIPSELSSITCECLSFEKKDRLKDVPTLIQKIERYLEGVPEWMHSKSLDVARKDDWKFQEHVLLAKHHALSEIPEDMEWVLMMISKSAFFGNVKIEAEFAAEEKSQGLEILFGVPEHHVRKHAAQGFSVKMNGDGLKLLKDQVEVATRPEIRLKSTPCRLRIEIMQETLRVSLDEEIVLNYAFPLPMSGNHVGLLLRDESCRINIFNVFVGSYNALINCLAIPDAFFAKQQMEDALEEYRRIAHGFEGRTEGWKALFREGVTLLALAQKASKAKAKSSLYEQALEQFDTLSSTPAAPLEYLGKSLVYHEQKEDEEEAKCLELALRKAHLHPLHATIASHVLFRLHEAAYESKYATYAIALLSLRLLPTLLEVPVHKELFLSLAKSLEPLPFLSEADLITKLSFWLGNVPVLKEQGAAFALSALQGNFEVPPAQVALQQGNFAEAEKLFSSYPKNELENEKHSLFVPYGCYLRYKKGEEAAMRHFSDISMTSSPPSTALLAHFLQGKPETKITPFLWQKMELLRQRALYAFCSNDLKKQASYLRKLCKLQNLIS